MTKMVFRSPGPERIHGFDVELLELPEEEADAKLAEGGWYATPTEAGEAAAARAAKLAEKDAGDKDDDNRKPTRAELETKATELGIPFNARVSDKKLGEAIAAKLAEQD
jgi:hypothetical protein